VVDGTFGFRRSADGSIGAPGGGMGGSETKSDSPSASEFRAAWNFVLVMVVENDAS
jgi:hypothetical protein